MATSTPFSESQPPPTFASPIVLPPSAVGRIGSQGGDQARQIFESVQMILAAVQFNPIWVKWFVDIAQLLTISGAGGNNQGIQHNALNGIQGGTTGSYYHFTQTQHDSLTGGGDSTLHYHASDRDRANHTGTQLLSTISDVTATPAEVNQLAVGLSVTITTAPLTGGGSTGSMTFANGVLTAQTPAT